ncbi:secreted effector J SseJ [Candidatus Rickettsiella viridis]|uniref:Secreted effector J SseJ n=1 Tax=Candidatus Rickettsiella viridis TaxID=676208 RepID=A0A2Z5V3Z1_9COXI|nr:SGNH/GDSL hydrolase family protein [Candidatus Rickettsiella viridis]BBB15162.1 secreted effector J SseJ [Candidatus Rickettsiella viridis]
MANSISTFNGKIYTLGDSLSDTGNGQGKYNQTLFGPYKFGILLEKHPNNMFTDSFTYVYTLGERIEYLLRNAYSESPLHSHYFAPEGHAVDRTLAEGGSTASNSQKWSNLFRVGINATLKSKLFNFGYLKKQVRALKNMPYGISPNDLCIIFAGNNDFATVCRTGNEGVSSALNAVENTVSTLSTGKNSLHHILLLGLPNPTLTPWYENASTKITEPLKQAVQSYNEGLKKLTAEYTYIDFSTSPIFHLETLDDSDAFLKQYKIKQAILFIGQNTNLQALFIQDGKFVQNPKGEMRTVPVKLPKKYPNIIDQAKSRVINQEQQNPLGLKIVERPSEPEFIEWMKDLMRDAKLNVDVKIFDTDKVFTDILENPEKYSLTNCPIYYSNNLETLEGKLQGNALLAIPCKDNQGHDSLEACLFIDGKPVMSENKIIKIPFSKSECNELNKLIEEEKNHIFIQLKDHKKHGKNTKSLISRLIKSVEDRQKYDTRECSVYYSNNLEKAKVEITGNALLIIPVKDKQGHDSLEACLFIDGKPVMSGNTIKKNLLNNAELDELNKRIEKKKNNEQEKNNDVSKIRGPYRHGASIVQLFARIIPAFKAEYKHPIDFTDKKELFCKDLFHPKGQIHFSLGSALFRFINENYEIQPDKQFSDDMGITPRSKGIKMGSHEAPGSLNILRSPSSAFFHTPQQKETPPTSSIHPTCRE